MEQACDHIEAASVQGWIRHTRRFFQRCLANEDMWMKSYGLIQPDGKMMNSYSILVAFTVVFLQSVFTSCSNFYLSTFTFTFMHLADAFIQSDLQCIQAIHLYCQYVCSLGIEPTTIALLTQCSNH